MKLMSSDFGVDEDLELKNRRQTSIYIRFHPFFKKRKL